MRVSKVADKVVMDKYLMKVKENCYSTLYFMNGWGLFCWKKMHASLSTTKEKERNKWSLRCVTIDPSFEKRRYRWDFDGLQEFTNIGGESFAFHFVGMRIFGLNCLLICYLIC